MRFAMFIRFLTACALAFVAPLTLSSHAHDWPRFLGPTANGTYAGKDVRKDKWAPDGPGTVWKIKVGEGYSSPVISGERLVLFQRIGQNEVIQCLDANSGKQLWTSQYSTKYRDSMGHHSGPRATPAIHGNLVVTYGAEGTLSARQLNSGKEVWSVNTRKLYSNDTGFFGIATSPLIDSDTVIVNVGGPNGAGIIGFGLSNGKERWRTSQAAASYSSPTAATINDKRYGFILTREGLTALNPGSGKVYFDVPWRPSYDASVSAAVPLVIEDHVFLSVSYGTGATLLQVNEVKPRSVWAGDDILSNHYATSVHHDGYLYGFDGRQERGCNLRCVELKTGKVIWSKDRFGSGTLINANGTLLILTERGELVQAPATPKGFTIFNRAQVLGFQARAHAALANGRFYARDASNLICINLSKK